MRDVGVGMLRDIVSPKTISRNLFESRSAGLAEVCRDEKKGERDEAEHNLKEHRVRFLTLC